VVAFIAPHSRTAPGWSRQSRPESRRRLSAGHDAVSLLVELQGGPASLHNECPGFRAAHRAIESVSTHHIVAVNRNPSHTPDPACGGSGPQKIMPPATQSTADLTIQAQNLADGRWPPDNTSVQRFPPVDGRADWPRCRLRCFRGDLGEG
jgi:hypothetical protein